MSEPSPPGWTDPRAGVVLAIAAVVVLSPLRAAPGESPWPVTLALAGVLGAVALGGWLVLRKTPPPAE